MVSNLRNKQNKYSINMISLYRYKHPKLSAKHITSINKNARDAFITIADTDQTHTLTSGPDMIIS